MTIEEINELEKELDQTREKLEDYKNALLEQEMKDKQHKSLSDYRCYKELESREEYKYISSLYTIEQAKWNLSWFDEENLTVGNIYSIDTPNELLEREIKKRQLWFALEKHLKEKGCLATSEDWKDKEKEKYYIFYDYYDNEFDIGDNLFCKDNVIYSTDKVALYNYMKTLTTEDIKIMFDVE